MSKKDNYIIAGIAHPQPRLSTTGSQYMHPDTFVITISPTLADAKDFIDRGKVPDMDTLQYIVIEEMINLSTKSKIQRWYICKDGEVNQLADAPTEYKKTISMVSM